MKKTGKTARPFRYDLNQIPYEYTVEERNRFKGLDLIDRVPDELWTEVRTGDREQDYLHGKEIQKSKMAVWGSLTNSCEKKKKQRNQKLNHQSMLDHRKKTREFQRTFTSASLTTLKPLTVWITTNGGILLKRLEYPTTLPAS